MVAGLLERPQRPLLGLDSVLPAAFVAFRQRAPSQCVRKLVSLPSSENVVVPRSWLSVWSLFLGSRSNAPGNFLRRGAREPQGEQYGRPIRAGTELPPVSM